MMAATLGLGFGDHEVAILGALAVTFLDDEFALFLAGGRRDLAAALGLAVEADQTVREALFEKGDRAGEPLAVMLGNLAERAVAHSRGLGLRLAGRTRIADFRPEQALVASALAVEFAILVEAGEFHDARGRWTVRLRPGAFAGPFQRAISLHGLQDFAQERALLAFQMKAAGDFLLGGGAGIVAEKVEYSFTVREAHKGHIGRIGGKCAGDLRWGIPVSGQSRIEGQ
jgi:hypothetical protein